MNENENLDYYQLLGIEPSATISEIKKAYRKLAIQYHPDKNQMKSAAEQAALEQKFKEIVEAYECLTCPNKRAIYDQQLRQNKAREQQKETDAQFGNAQAYEENVPPTPHQNKAHEQQKEADTRFESYDGQAAYDIDAELEEDPVTSTFTGFDDFDQDFYFSTAPHTTFFSPPINEMVDKQYMLAAIYTCILLSLLIQAQQAPSIILLMDIVSPFASAKEDPRGTFRFSNCVGGY